jgi:hypothetical protein
MINFDFINFIHIASLMKVIKYFSNSKYQISSSDFQFIRKKTKSRDMIRTKKLV